MGRVKMYKKIIFSSVLLIFVGCGESEVEKVDSPKASASGIKVTENAVDTKVKDKKSKANSGQFYYSYNKEKNSSSYNSEDSKTKTTIDAYLNIKSPYEKVRITMMIKRLSKDYIIKCSPCHDDYANGVIGPSLLDKDDKFIYERIMEFKTGKKKNPLMKELVNQIDDDKLKNIAKEISNFNKEIRKMRREK
jgi:cytochrome c553